MSGQTIIRGSQLVSIMTWTLLILLSFIAIVYGDNNENNSETVTSNPNYDVDDNNTSKGK